MPEFHDEPKKITVSNVKRVLKDYKVLYEKHSFDIGGECDNKNKIITVSYSTSDGKILILAHEVLHALGYLHKDMSVEQHEQVENILESLDEE